jgi:hypothetical protein
MIDELASLILRENYHERRGIVLDKVPHEVRAPPALGCH